MKKGNTVVFGIYKTRTAAENAVHKLREMGFRASDISVLFPQEPNADTLAHVKHSKAPEGVAAGAGTGIVLGGAFGWLVGTGVVAVAGLGALVAAGPIIALLAGAGFGSVVGTLAGGLIGAGIPEYEALRFESFVKEGGILLSVHVDDLEWKYKAKDTLEITGAEDIASTREEPSHARIDRFSNIDRPLNF